MISKIISGGQTGVDRAGLDTAIELGIPHGGCCPRGRRAEDGPIAAHYQLIEADSPDYAVRTEINVDHSDGTLILYRQILKGGTGRTVELCRLKGKPLFLVDIDQSINRQTFDEWLTQNKIRTLNIAGPRESQVPGIYLRAKRFLMELFSTDLPDEHPHDQP